MRYYQRYLLIFFLVMSGGLSPPSFAEESTIHWAKQPVEPFYVIKGTNKEQGTGDLILRKLQQLLPDYQHISMHINYPRMVHEYKQHRKTCSLLHKTLERQNFMVFSNTIALMPSYAIYVNNNLSTPFDKQKTWQGEEIALEKFLQTKNKPVFGYVAGHSFGPARDTLLNKYWQNLTPQPSYWSQDSLPKMLLAHRVDFILETPWILNYQLQKLGRKNGLKKIRLTDVPAYEPIYVACEKTAWGQQVIKQINDIKPAILEQTRSYSEHWLTEEEIAVYRKSFKEEVTKIGRMNELQNTENKNPID